jgi:mono/diheme cytochrome c family protein
MTFRAIGFSIILAAASMAGSAQDDKAHNQAMKTSGKLMDSMRKNLEAKQMEAAAKDAKEMDALFAPVVKFWEAKNLPKAVEWSQGVQTAAKEIVTATGSGNTEAAAAGMKAMGGSCRGCHTQHREKLPDGIYKMKL